MAVSEFSQNSATITATLRYLVANSTTPSYSGTDGVYQLFLDLNNLAAGDLYQISCFESVNSGGTTRLVWRDNITGPLETPVFASPSLILLHGWDFGLQKISGTDRSIIWSVRKAG